jgi:hypothetical protein
MGENHTVSYSNGFINYTSAPTADSFTMQLNSNIMKKLFFSTTLLFSLFVTAQNERHNFYVTGKDKGFHFSALTVKAQAFFHDVFHKKFHFIIASSDAEAAEKITRILDKRHGMIGSLWFDSHGLYKQGYSSFHIGGNEFSYKNINDTSATTCLQQLKAYCDQNTNIGIGSCYGGATFTFPGNEHAPAGRMNGDSLMIGIGKIFSSSTIYASESWVMNKPGIFGNNFAFAGYPWGKKYKQPVWMPVWNYLGNWKKYNNSNTEMLSVNTVALDKKGNINIRSRNYLELGKAKRKLQKNLAKLEVAANQKSSTNEN